MFNLSENSTLQGRGLVILNVFRVFNLIGLTGVLVASYIMIVMAFKTGNFFFFDFISQLFTTPIVLFLAVSELGVFVRYYERNWPLLSPAHGVGWLGLAMIVMGCQTLGGLNRPSNSVDNLGLPLWRAIIAGGALSIAFGFINIVSALVFRDGSAQINSRNVRAEGSLASARSVRSDNYSARSAPLKEPKTKRWTARFGKKRPEISAPMPVSDPEKGYGGPGDYDEVILNDEDRRSPIQPNIRRPDTAMHPIHHHNSGVSRYSEVSHLPRF